MTVSGGHYMLDEVPTVSVVHRTEAAVPLLTPVQAGHQKSLTATPPCNLHRRHTEGGRNPYHTTWRRPRHPETVTLISPWSQLNKAAKSAGDARRNATAQFPRADCAISIGDIVFTRSILGRR